MLLSNRAMIGSNPAVLYSFTNALTTDLTLRNNRSNWNKTGRLRNYHCGDANVAGVVAGATAALGGDIALLVFTDTTHGSGYFAPGQVLTGSGVAGGTRITAYITGTGANNGGTYAVNISQTVTAQTIIGTNPSITTKASQPAGNTHPVAYILAQKPGRVSSRKTCYLGTGGQALLTVGSLIFTSSCVVGVEGSAVGTLVIGSLIDGTTAIIIDGSAVGSMTWGAEGTATITVETNGAILGHLSAEGTTSILLGAVADATALGWLSGNGPIEINGTLDPYATGWMSGSTETSGLTPTGIAIAVWNRILDGSITAEDALLAAGAAGDPMSVSVPGSYSPGQAGYVLGTNLDKKVSEVSLVVSGAALNKRAEDVSILTGSWVQGDLLSTWNEDTDYYQVSDGGGVIDVEATFDIGTGYPTGAMVIGCCTGLNDSVGVYVRNWLYEDNFPIGWGYFGVLGGKNTYSNIHLPLTLFITNVGTGADEGKVKVKFRGTGLSTANFYLNQIYINYSPQPSDPVSIANAVWDDIDAQFLVGCVKNKKYLTKEGSTWYLIIRNDLDTSDILKKAMKDKDGNEISDIAAATLAMEIKSSV